jgi:hypothetical protein
LRTIEDEKVRSWFSMNSFNNMVESTGFFSRSAWAAAVFHLASRESVRIAAAAGKFYKIHNEGAAETFHLVHIGGIAKNTRSGIGYSE